MLESVKDKFLNNSNTSEIVKTYSLNLLFKSKDEEVDHKSNDDNYYHLIIELSTLAIEKYLSGISMDELVHAGECLLSGNQRFWKMINTGELQDLKSLELELRLLYKKNYNKNLPDRIITLIKMFSADEKLSYLKGQLCSANIPNFKVAPFELNSRHAFDSIVKEYFVDLKKEAELLVNDQVKAIPYKMYGPNWSRLPIYRNGKFEDKYEPSMPNTFAFVKKCEELGRLISFDLLLMEPGKKLFHHSDGFAFFDNWQLGLIIPNDCGLNVMGEKIMHEEGKSFLFNDSFNHYAWNGSEERRVIATAWVVHREWSEDEVHALKFLAKTMKWGS
tara:strand:+ start:251053 stop:252048 length:996 start_codon:yes stop_codon:yes gene_type:complete